MIELESSLHKFKLKHFGRVDDFLSTADSNIRDTLMIACSDHGSAPDNVSFAGPDRFFILQHLAASVPAPDDSKCDNAFDSILYGFERYDIRHVVVCGHLGCRVIPNWLNNTDLHDAGNLRARFRASSVIAVNDHYPELRGRDYVERLICEHTIFQLENLQSHPSIRRRLDANELKLHLWIVNDATARVLAFDPSRGNLVPIERMPLIVATEDAEITEPVLP